jgi:hypothetical protein
VHTFGKEIAFHIGPLSITNELKVKLNYIGLFELNPNPVPQRGERRSPKVSVDVHPISGTSDNHTVRFSIKPHIRVGISRTGSWREILRGASLRGTLQVRHAGRRIIAGDVAVKWSPERGVTVTAEVALVSW